MSLATFCRLPINKVNGKPAGIASYSWLTSREVTGVKRDEGGAGERVLKQGTSACGCTGCCGKVQVHAEEERMLL